LGNVLYLAWRDANTLLLTIVRSEDKGHTFTDPVGNAVMMDAAPGMVAVSGALFVAWKGAGNERISLGMVNLAGV
jgi:hypothetical protein